MRTLLSPEIHRNMGFWNERTQELINKSRVAVAGTGGAGYLFVLELARIGVSSFMIADPECFDRTNFNRVLGARIDTVGKNKAEVLKEDILLINSTAKVDVYTKGINSSNVKDFLCSSDIVLNAIEVTMPELGVMLCRKVREYSRELGIAIPVMDIEYIGHAGQATSFDPFSRFTYERYMGIKGGEEAPLEYVAKQVISPSRYLTYLPPYGDLETLKSIYEGAPLPSNMIGAGVATQLGVAEYVKHIRYQNGEKTKKPTYAPFVRWYDAYTGKNGRTRFPQISFYRHLAKVTVRNKLNCFEKASYSKEERAKRGDV